VLTGTLRVQSQLRPDTLGIEPDKPGHGESVEFLNRLIRPDYQNAAWDVREYALSVKVEPHDRQCSDGLKVELHRYISERTLLRAGLCSSYLNLLASKHGPNSASGMTHWVFSRGLTEHFESLPGVASAVGQRILYDALHKYYVREVAELTAIYLGELTGKSFDAARMHELPSLVALLADEFRACMQLIDRKVATVKDVPAN
jgi:hypothetical protein